jgi:16S rRNA (guanine527-N7)-methyltransferase
MLKQLFKKYGFDLSKDTLDKFDDLLKLFKEKNEVINLSSLKNDEDIIEKHFIDSLMLTKYIDLY